VLTEPVVSLPVLPVPVPGVDAATAEGVAGTAPDGVAGADEARPPRRPGLSPSRANDFMQCPLLFRFRVVDRLPEPPSPAAVRGTLVHTVLERLFDAPAGRRTLEAAQALLAPAWSEMVAEQPDCAQVLTDPSDTHDWFRDAGLLLERSNRLQPADRELAISTELEDGLELRGIVDRLDVAPDGAIRVVDYKTGKSPREGYESGALFQMRFYALVLTRLRGRMPAMLQLVYLGDGRLLRHVPDAGELEATERKIRAIWSGVRDAAERNAWTPRRSALCSWCAHQALCPAFGGTPPEVDPAAVERSLGIRPLLADV
jgi:putative RecB family exonuclease